MQQVRNPFVVTLHYAFQDASRVYFVLEHVGGGDLFSALETHTRLTLTLTPTLTLPLTRCSSTSPASPSCIST